MIVTVIPTNLVTNYLLLLACPFVETKIKNQILGKVTGNISVFYLWRFALLFKGIPNSIDFHKRIFLHVIPVRIIVY